MPLLLILNTGAVVFAVGLFLSILPGPDKAEATRNHPSSSAGGEPTSRSSTGALPEPAERGGVSWSLAEQALAAKDYQGALTLYTQLAPPSQGGLATPQGGHDEDPLIDLVVLRQAQCLKRLGDSKESSRLLTSITQSRLALARALANQALAVTDVEEGRWASARSKACAAIGSAEAFGSLDADCDFLAAYARTREVVALANMDIPLPAGRLITSDPLAGLKEADLQKLAADEPAAGALTTSLTPVSRSSEGGGLRAYCVRCRRAPLEDLLSRLSADTGREIRWDSVSPAARRRAVNLAMGAASEQRLAEVACGMCGLQARLTGEEIVIRDPETQATVAAKRDLLASEAMAAWRRSFLRWPDDGRLPEGQLALAAVYEAAGDVTSALSQYRMTAERYAAAEASPRSLLQSARLRMRIRDYGGAYADLLSLLDGHPEYPACEEAYLYLGQAAFQSDQVPQAIRAYRKLYYRDPSASAKAQACLGLGKCFHRQGDFTEAARWLWEYLDQAGATPGEDTWQAGMLAEKSEVALGQLSHGLKALRFAQAADTANAHRVETTIERAALLALGHDFVGAIGALQDLDPAKLSEGQTVATLLLRAGIFRSIGLHEAAISLLRARLPYSGDPNLGSLLTAEVGRCHADEGDYAAARTAFSEAVSKAKGGAAWEATCDLAQVCLLDGEPDQAIVLAGELVRSSCPLDLRRRGCEILAGAYIATRDYANAARVYEMMRPAPAQTPDAPGAHTKTPTE